MKRTYYYHVTIRHYKTKKMLYVKASDAFNAIKKAAELSKDYFNDLSSIVVTKGAPTSKRGRADLKRKKLQEEQNLNPKLFTKPNPSKPSIFDD